MGSEVADFREQQELRDQAARQGLYGLAIVANHQAITARLERGAERILRLFHEGKEQEAIALMAAPQWGEQADLSSEVERK
jgi:HAMP domain-containing protein